MIPVGVEQREVEALGDSVERPGNRIRLVAADDQPSDLLLAIDQTVWVPQRRHVAGNAVDRLGHEILVLHGLQRYGYAGEPPHRARPLAGAVHDHVGRHVAQSSAHADGSPILGLDSRHTAVLDDAYAAGAGAL